MNGTSVSLDGLKAHFVKILQPEQANVVVQMIDAYYDTARLSQWIRGVKIEMFELMWREGLRDPAVLKSPVVRELYLDRVLASRAAQNGFSIRPDGLPFDVITFNPWSFFQGGLGRGRFFIDWTGQKISAGGVKHMIRGHTIPLAYSSETVPGYAGLMKYVAKQVIEMAFGSSCSITPTLFGLRSGAVSGSTPMVNFSASGTEPVRAR